MKKDTVFKKIYDFYSKDLTSNEVERVFLKETQTRYNYFVRSMDKPQVHKSKFSHIFVFTKNLIIAFLRKLSPVIRIVFSLNIIVFIFSVIQQNWEYIFFSFVISNLLLVFEVAEKLTVRDELEVARDLQLSLIPKNPPEDNNFDISSYYETAKEVGGDFIDFINKENDSYYISIGDISGKGMSAALYMLQVRLLIRHLSDFADNPKSILVLVNKNIFKHMKKGLYFSSVLAEINKKDLKICRAGHTPLIYYNSSERTCIEIKQSGMAVGLNESELFEKSLEEYEIRSSKDDLILFYSDGLTETMNEKKEEFGTENIKELLILNSHKSADEIKNEILFAVNKFRGFAEIHDDISIIILKAK